MIVRREMICVFEDDYSEIIDDGRDEEHEEVKEVGV